MLQSLFLDLFSYLLKTPNKKVERALLDKGQATLSALGKTEATVAKFLRQAEEDKCQATGRGTREEEAARELRQGGEEEGEEGEERVEREEGVEGEERVEGEGEVQAVVFNLKKEEQAEKSFGGAKGGREDNRDAIEIELLSHEKLD